MKEKISLPALVIVAILAIILFMWLLPGEVFPATNYELSLMSYGDVSQFYMKLGQINKNIEWFTAYDRILAGELVRDDLYFEVFAFLPKNFFILGSYEKEFVSDFTESAVGIGWERAIPPVEWRIQGFPILTMRDNIDVAVSALRNDQVYAMPWVENRSNLKLLGIFYVKNTLGAYFPIGSDFRLKCKIDVIIHIVDPSGTMPLAMNLVLTNISGLNQNSINRIGAQLNF